MMITLFTNQTSQGVSVVFKVFELILVIIILRCNVLYTLYKTNMCKLLKEM